MEARTPMVPADVSLREMERLLDRLAVEVVAMGRDGGVLVGLYAWLEDQLARRRAHHAVLASARGRVRRLHGRTAARS
ncbi:MULTISPECIES: hypothetical protein [unclassified Sinorhizobium]|uniref:hypothetical protein n=1 Tax=unclassified Sinorhizobium TaxID=2613772 RepID=UPI0024C2AFDD|nr:MULTISPECIES: hypothetical protein [unclassified Sinorhizobium]MDK1376754.1 hypothetical protein [Sinorhizobium sp. 6-70]MDK1480871.1 hypothetical protein [Sinorhizobium sp. 6-117]